MLGKQLTLILVICERKEDHVKYINIMLDQSIMKPILVSIISVDTRHIKIENGKRVKRSHVRIDMSGAFKTLCMT